MIAVLMLLQRPLDWWIDANNFVRALQLGMAIGAGAIVYFGTLAVCGLRLSQLRLSGPNQGYP
jgi:hypothetical protein